MLKRLIEWIKSLFKKTTTSWTSEPVSNSIQPPAYTEPSEVPDAKKIVEAIEFLKPRVGIVTLYQLEVKLGHGLTDAQRRFAAARGVEVPAQNAPTAGVDRSGFDLGGSSGEGEYKMQVLQDGTYTFTYTIRQGTTSADITVFPGSGSRLAEVNGQPASMSHQIPVPAVPGHHNILISVKSRGDKVVGVQLRQS